MTEVNVDYINGFMRAISCGCHGCDYVPFYGAASFSHTENTIRESLEKHFDIKNISECNTPNWSNIENYSELEGYEWITNLSKLLNKWVKSKSNFDHEFIDLFKDDLIDMIIELVGSSPKCFYANIEHPDFDYENDTLGFVCETHSFYLHFSHSD